MTAMPPTLDVVHAGFPTSPWQAAIDGWFLRTPNGKIRKFSTDSACHRALRQEVRRRGLEWTIPHERHWFSAKTQ